MSCQLLASSQPMLLKQYSPRCTYGDGNCMFRAVSLALYGTQEMHEYLRFITAVQIIKNPQLYDNSSENFVIKDERVLTAPYSELIKNAMKIGCYLELIHLFALSATIDLKIQSYCIPLSYMGFNLHPYTIVIDGNNCKHQLPECQSDLITIMWTNTFLTPTPPDPNHCVVLIPRYFSNAGIVNISSPILESTRKSNEYHSPAEPLLSIPLDVHIDDRENDFLPLFQTSTPKHAPSIINVIESIEEDNFFFNLQQPRKAPSLFEESSVSDKNPSHERDSEDCETTYEFVKEVSFN